MSSLQEWYHDVADQVQKDKSTAMPADLQEKIIALSKKLDERKAALEGIRRLEAAAAKRKRDIGYQRNQLIKQMAHLLGIYQQDRYRNFLGNEDDGY